MERIFKQESEPGAARVRRALIVSTDRANHLSLLTAAGLTGFQLELRFADAAEPEILGDLDPVPELIVMSLPNQTGLGLSWIETLRAQAGFRRVPIVALMAPGDPEAVAAYYRAGCNCCVVRPASSEALQRVARTMFQFWLDLVILPDPVRV